MDLMKFIPEYMVILVAVGYVLGVGLKKIGGMPDKLIPIGLLIFNITFAILLCIINAEYKTMLEAITNAILQGILCWGVEIGVNQTIKQAQKEE